MRVTIELREGPHHGPPTREGIDAHIEMLDRLAKGDRRVVDIVGVADLKSILLGIRKALPLTASEKYAERMRALDRRLLSEQKARKKP